MDIRNLQGFVSGKGYGRAPGVVLRSGNGCMRRFVHVASRERALGAGGQLTVGGVAVRTGILLLLVFVGALFAWYWMAGHQDTFYPLLWGAMGGAFLFGLIASFSPGSAVWSAPLYAVSQGVLLGSVSLFFSELYGTVLVLQAVLSTFAVAFTMLLLYASGLVRVTSRMRRVVRVAMAGAGVFYLVSFVASWFGLGQLSVLREGVLGVGVSLLMIGIASFTLVLDFDAVARAAAEGAAKRLEWMAAFGLVASLLWLYVELLRLLSLLRR